MLFFVFRFGQFFLSNEGVYISNTQYVYIGICIIGIQIVWAN